MVLGRTVFVLLVFAAIRLGWAFLVHRKRQITQKPHAWQTDNRENPKPTLAFREGAADDAGNAADHKDKPNDKNSSQNLRGRFYRIETKSGKKFLHMLSGFLNLCASSSDT